LFFSITISSNSPCNFFEWFNKIKLINYDNGINLIWFICFDLKIQSRVEHIADLFRAEPVRRTKVKVIALCMWWSICVLQAILWLNAFLVLKFLLNWTIVIVLSRIWVPRLLTAIRTVGLWRFREWELWRIMSGYGISPLP
jgi:hypothetical protein